MSASVPQAMAAGGSPARRRGKFNYAPYLLTAPTVILLLAFIAYPIATVFYYSLQHYNVTQPWYNGFAGIDNFTKLLTGDPKFWSSLWITIEWVVSEVVLQLLLGLALALVINEAFRGRGLARAVVFAPWAISGVLTTEIWLLIYNPVTGLGKLERVLGLGNGNVAPLASPHGAFLSALIAELWRGIPFFAILLLADLQSIPEDLYEAARVDRANVFGRFRYVTLSHLKDAIVLSTLLRAVWEFNNVDLLYTLTGGGPADTTTTLPLYIAQEATVAHNFGYGAALTVAAFVILLAFSGIYLRLTRFGQEA